MSKRSESFVDAVISWKEQPGKAAKMKKADNPVTEFMAWELVCPWCGDQFGYTEVRLPYEIIGAAVARAKLECDGALSLGKALSACSDRKGEELAKDSVTAHLRRLLSCTAVSEVCMVLRPVLGLILSKGVSLDYSDVLDDLLYFSEEKRRKWALDFFYRKEDVDAGDTDKN